MKYLITLMIFSVGCSKSESPAELLTKTAKRRNRANRRSKLKI